MLHKPKPNKRNKRILFILKERNSYSAHYTPGRTSGLYNSAKFSADVLREAGFAVKLVEVVDNNSIDHEVAEFHPDIVIIEALWVVPEKFVVLQGLYPHVKWIIRIHSEAAFLAQEGTAIAWLSAYPLYPNVFVAVNSLEAMKQVMTTVKRLAQSTIAVLIHGETGTGKEVIATAIHDASPRKKKPLRTINCAAIPETLIESVLFGHEHGAFTGAEKQARGIFEQADGGTVLLDEIGELTPSAQAALLRVLETKKVTRVGGEKEIDVDVRVIAATHRDLRADVNTKRFRADLYYRLAVIRVTVPPLRERRDDIPLLASHFAQEALGNRARPPLPPQTLEALFGELTRHDWPGNVRELRNVVERAAILADPKLIHAGVLDVATSELQRSIEQAVHKQVSLRAVRAECEREYLTDLLRATDGDLDEAARIAQIHRKSLERLIRRHKLREPRSQPT